VQEVQAERAVEALARYVPQTVRALRDGSPIELAAAELVRGDVVMLEEGERVPGLAGNRSRSSASFAVS
jgi:magnesium-transporting ATPase (P-type)